MKTAVGLWVDHREAVIVSVCDNGEITRIVSSNMESQPRRQGGKCAPQAFKARQIPADDSRDRKFMAGLNHYYDRIIKSMGDVGAVVIFGPGEAKHELKKRLEHEGLGFYVVGMITADKMTAGQIAAKVRDFFRPANPVVQSP